LGHAFGRHIDEITPQIHRYSIGFLIVLALAAVIYVVYRLVRKPRGAAS